MTKEQKSIVEQKVILLNINDVMGLTGWSENIVRNTFAHDKEFPTIKKGKSYQVELGAFINYLSKPRTNK